MGDQNQVVFCRLCLRTDLTLKYILSDDAQRKFIQTFFEKNGFPQDLDKSSYACFECRSLLHRSYSFVRKTLRAQKALYTLQNQQETITNSSLQSLNREKYKIKSNLACCKSKTIIVLHHYTDFKQNSETITPLEKKPEGNINFKTDPSKLQDDYLNQIDSTVFLECSNFNQVDSSFLSEDNNNSLDTRELRYKMTIDTKHTNPCIKEFTFDDECIPNIENNEKDSNFNGDVKTEPEIYIFNDDVDSIEDNSECNDPLASELAMTESRTVIDITSSDHSDTLEKIRKRKRKRKKNKNKTKTSIPKSKVSLDLFSSDDENKAKIKKKREKVVWPKMPILEERFRSRKDVNYKALNGLDEEEDDGEEEKKEISKQRRKKAHDNDFVPTDDDSSDESADNSYDSYDDEGKVIRYKEDTREFPMKCELCEGIITSKQEHISHYLHMHSAVQYPYRIEKTELCRYCGKSFNKKRLAEHEDNHRGKKIECDICHKKYRSRVAMSEHQKRVHEKLARCVCNYCDRGFFMKTDLLRHIRIHTGEKPFKCHICNYRVAHKGNLKVHIRQFHQHAASNTKKKSTDGVKKKKTDKSKSGGNENLDDNSSRKKGKKKIKSGGNKRKRKPRKVVTGSNTE